MNITEFIKTMEDNNVNIHDLITESHQFAMKTYHNEPGQKREHIALAIPINREITAESFTSLMQLYSHLNRSYEVSFSSSIATYLHEGRSLILKNLYEIHKQKPIDYVLWVDSDMVYTIQDFEKSLQMVKRRDIPMLSGLYLTKRSIANKPVFMYYDGKDYKLADNYPQENCLIKVDAVGFGFFLCRGKELFRLYEKYGSTLFKLGNDNAGKMIGEDVIFSKAVNDEKIPMFVWTEIQVGHEGHIIKPKHFDACNTKETKEKIQWERLL